MCVSCLFVCCCLSFLRKKPPLFTAPERNQRTRAGKRLILVVVGSVFFVVRYVRVCVQTRGCGAKAKRKITQETHTVGFEVKREGWGRDGGNLEEGKRVGFFLGFF